MKKNGKYILGVDVGGTKIMAALVKPSGTIVARERVATPRGASPEAVLLAVLETMDKVMVDHKVKAKQLRAIGLGVPGVVDPDEGSVIVTPNMNLTGMSVASHVEDRFGVPVALGNDVNLGTLGEKWLGAARFASSAVGIFVGTGIGAGVIVDNRLVRGSREAAGEVGHIVMQVNGPQCGCGNKGCLEAVASRTAIERDIRQAVEAGKKTILSKLVGDDLRVIRSRILKRAVDEGDALVRRVLRHAAEMLGYACLTVRHLLDPEVIVMGGGVMEACGDFMLPIIEEIVEADALAGARFGGRIVQSQMGDDAVVLGAAAIAMEKIDRLPWKDQVQDIPEYSEVSLDEDGVLHVGSGKYRGDVLLLAGGKVKKRDTAAVRDQYGTDHNIGPEELKRLAKGEPTYVIVGTGLKGEAALTTEGREYLRKQGIWVESMPTPRAVQQYNRATGRRAALLHMGC